MKKKAHEILKKNRHFYSIRAIDLSLHERFKMPKTTLENYCKGFKKFPEKWEKSAETIFKEITQ